LPEEKVLIHLSNKDVSRDI